MQDIHELQMEEEDKNELDPREVWMNEEGALVKELRGSGQ